MAGALLEFTDLLWPVDADRAPLPVTKADVVARLTECGQDHAARIVSRMPVVNGRLIPVMWTPSGFVCIASCNASVRSCSSAVAWPLSSDRSWQSCADPSAAWCGSSTSDAGSASSCGHWQRLQSGARMSNWSRRSQLRPDRRSSATRQVRRPGVPVHPGRRIRARSSDRRRRGQHRHFQRPHAPPACVGPGGVLCRTGRLRVAAAVP